MSAVIKMFTSPMYVFRNQGSNYPLRGGKVTLWEGGVRGVGFVHSKLIRKKGRVSYDLIDATDWLPTFYHLAGGNVSLIEDKIDGMNVWDTLAHGRKSPRTEVGLNNIARRHNSETEQSTPFPTHFQLVSLF